jgi:hypothetical protein
MDTFFNGAGLGRALGGTLDGLSSTFSMTDEAGSVSSSAYPSFWCARAREDEPETRGLHEAMKVLVT